MSSQLLLLLVIAHDSLIRACSKLTEDSEFALYRAVVLRKGADTYRNLCREKRSGWLLFGLHCAHTCC